MDILRRTIVAAHLCGARFRVRKARRDVLSSTLFTTSASGRRQVTHPAHILNHLHSPAPIPQPLKHLPAERPSTGRTSLNDGRPERAARCSRDSYACPPRRAPQARCRCGCGRREPHTHIRARARGDPMGRGSHCSRSRTQPGQRGGGSASGGRAGLVIALAYQFPLQFVSPLYMCRTMPLSVLSWFSVLGCISITISSSAVLHIYSGLTVCGIHVQFFTIYDFATFNANMMSCIPGVSYTRSLRVAGHRRNRIKVSRRIFTDTNQSTDALRWVTVVPGMELDDIDIPARRSQSFDEMMSQITHSDHITVLYMCDSPFYPFLPDCFACRKCSTTTKS